MEKITSTAADLIQEQTRVLLARIFPSPRPFSIQLWGQAELPADNHSQFTLVLNHPGALRRMFSPPIELSVGEAYIYVGF